MTDASDHPEASGRRHLFKRRAARLQQDAELAVDIDLDFSECDSSRLRALRIISGLGLPMK